MPAVIAAFIIGVWVIALPMMWPLIGAVAGAVLIAWMLRNGILWADEASAAAKQKRQALAERADTQHQQIMRGDVIAGTYGDYLPPPEMR